MALEREVKTGFTDGKNVFVVSLTLQTRGGQSFARPPAVVPSSRRGCRLLVVDAGAVVLAGGGGVAVRNVLEECAERATDCRYGCTTASHGCVVEPLVPHHARTRRTRRHTLPQRTDRVAVRRHLHTARLSRRPPRNAASKPCAVRQRRRQFQPLARAKQPELLARLGAEHAAY